MIEKLKGGILTRSVVWALQYSEPHTWVNIHLDAYKDVVNEPGLKTHTVGTTVGEDSPTDNSFFNCVMRLAHIY